jgi:uncharacterized membrane protein YbhN (UPF0104 family)
LAAAAIALLSSSSDVSWTVVAIGGVVAVLLVAASWLLLVPDGRFGAARAWLLARMDGTGASGPESASRPTWKLMAGGVANGLMFHAGSIGLTWLLVLAMDPATPLWPMVAVITVARLSLAVPISPNGLGVQEGTLAALVAGLRLAPQPALAAMLVARISMLLLAAIGVTLLLLDRRESGASRDRHGTLAGALPERGDMR